MSLSVVALLALAVGQAVGTAHDLPTDPLDEQAMHGTMHTLSSGMMVGPSICDFDNGTRVPGALPKGFFGPEPCVFTSGMVLRGNDPLGGKGAAAGEHLTI